MLNPYLEIVLATIIWGSAGVFIKYLTLPPTTITFFRLFFPTIIIFVFLLFRKIKFFRGNMKVMLVASFLNAARMFFYFFSYTHTSIANALILIYTWPIFATILSSIFLKEKVSRKTVLLLALSFIGMVIIYINKQFSFSDMDFLGMTAMVISSLIYSMSFVLFKKESNNYSRFEMVFYQNFLGTFIFLPFLFINKPFPTPLQFTVSGIYATLIGVIGMGLFFSALKRLKASVTSSLVYMEIISGIFFGIIFMGEVLTWNMVVGGLLIVLSSMLLRK